MNFGRQVRCKPKFMSVPTSEVPSELLHVKRTQIFILKKYNRKKISVFSEGYKPYELVWAGKKYSFRNDCVYSKDVVK